MVAQVEFFNPNEVKSNCTFTFTTANVDNAAFLYDNDVMTTLSSDGSSDGAEEKLKVEFASSRTIDFIGVFGHNFKTGNVKYLDASMVEQDFTPAIAWTANTTVNNNAYYVTEVACYGIVVNVTHTISGDEKSIGELRALNQFATLPSPKKFTPSLNIEQNLKTKYDGGKDKIIDGIKFNATIGFDDLDDDDVETLFSLAERGRPFYVYLASLSSENAKRFFRVQDQYLVNMTNDPKPKLPDGLVDSITWEADIKVEEV